MNAIKDSIKSGRTVVGTTAGPNVDVSVLADAGYDFLLFDTQHSAWEIKQLQPSIQATFGSRSATGCVGWASRNSATCRRNLDHHRGRPQAPPCENRAHRRHQTSQLSRP